MINSKILGSVLVMGMALALAGAGTMAYFSDTEVSKGNTFTAGELDLMIDFESTYNGEPDASWTMRNLDGETFFDFDDIKPGDNGWGEISVHVYDNPAHLWIWIENLVDNENGMNEPEMEVDDDNMGELSQNIMVEICGETRTLENMSEAGWYIGEIDNCENYYYEVTWEVPTEVGNEIQSDSVSFDIVFYAEQTRHNVDPANPWNGAE